MADRIIFVCIIVLAAVYFYATSQIPTLQIGDPLGPRAFPYLLGICLLVSAGMLFVEILRARKQQPAAPTPVAQGEKQDMRHLLVIGVVVVWTALYFAVFEWLGHVISTSIYLIALTAYFNRGKWMANVLTSVLFSIGSYLMFSKLLEVNLPSGILPF